MCGISGFFGKGTWDDIHSMTRALTHRGPDAEGYWADETQGIYLGHRRLSIIDLEGGIQPMWTADQQLGVIFNGEIYNFQELRKQLVQKGHQFHTDHSDTEVLLYGYREWGEQLPTHLNGMWVFAILDREKNTLFLSRDRFGKKPLFYTQQGDTFAFASELRALIQHKSVSAKLSTLALQKYFAYNYIPAPYSLYQQIYKLPGGQNLTLHLADHSFFVKPYWEFVLDPEPEGKQSEAEWSEQIRSQFSEAVNRRLVSDVPLGFLLSGGVDSSAVVAYGAKHAQQIKTFSVGFEEASFDESAYGKEIAQKFGTTHHLRVCSVSQAQDLIPEVLEKLDEPMGDGSLLPTYLLCQETRKHVTVALSGDGGDELFAGYDPFRALKLAGWYQRWVPGQVHQAISMMLARLPVSHRNMSLDFKIKRTLRGLGFDRTIWNAVWMGPLTITEVQDLFQIPVSLEELYSEAIAVWEACEQSSLVDKALQFYTRLYMQDDILVKIDRASMMNSLELRSPFLDIDFVNLVRRIPTELKLKKGQTKYILKKALEPILPNHIIYRPKKGFGMPIGQWFQEGSLGFQNHDSIPPEQWPFVQKLWNEHRQGSADHRLFLWSYWLLNQLRSRAHSGVT